MRVENYKWEHIRKNYFPMLRAKVRLNIVWSCERIDLIS